jgi:polysaccharide deacetylase family protein (PEP-CTERM system associated)
MHNILSVDVEDWFHILDLRDAPDVDAWSRLESRVEANFNNLLDELARRESRATCFFLGWIAERHPELVRRASREGHEIASHGYAHQLIYGLSPRQFSDDIGKAKRILEDIVGMPVVGYRAPGFSIVAETTWAFEAIRAAGYEYDSSVFPAARGHGGLEGAEVKPYRVSTSKGDLLEFPISVAHLLGKNICFFGGGYLRLFPYPIIQYMSRRLNEEGRPVIYYLHPREIDPGHPRMKMNLLRRFKSYVNLSTTLPKLRRLTKDQSLVPFRDWMKQHPIAAGDRAAAPGPPPGSAL